MPDSFFSPDGDLEKIFVTDYQDIDDYAATGSLWLWGRSGYGGLGDNTNFATIGAPAATSAGRSSPVQTVSGGTNWKQVGSAGDSASAIKTDGTLWTWGRNGFGSLGDNTVVNKSSPVQTVAGGNNWKQVSGGLCLSAIKTDGTLWTWGLNSDGQLGDNTTTHRSSPVQTVAGGNNWKQTSSSSNCTAAIKTDGTLWLWGRNSFGQLGDNTTTHRSSPVQTVAGGNNWKQVSVGGYSGTSAAIKTDGTLWAWGYGASGGLGDNLFATWYSPVQTVSGGTNWKLVSVGNYHVAAIKTDGTLWLWGNNTYGQIGDNTINNKGSPVQTISGGTNWKFVDCTGSSRTCAIKTDGTLWTWGINTNGAIGDNTVVNKSSPVQTVAGGTNWKQVATGFSGTAAIHFYDAGNLYPNS